MDEISIDNSNTPEPTPPKPRTKREISLLRLKRRLLRHVWLARAGIILGLVAGVYLFVLLLGVIFGKTPLGGNLGLVWDFVFTPTSKIQSIEGRTNILILGKAGEGHEASDLTDTIIFASVSHKNSAVSLVSLPRDIWIPSIRAKLNSAYFWGKEKKEGGGIILAKSLVEEIVGEPVDYGLVIDFSAFTKIVDVVGGIEVDIENGFVDEKYPIPGKEDDECGGDREFRCRYETLVFKEGKTVMDGETALKFVRSRNAEGQEGTDLARAVRQQKVLLAIEEKILSSQVLLSPRKVFKIVGVLKDSLETDVTPSAGAILARRALGARNSVTPHILSEEFLFHPPVSPRYDNQYVFIPKGDSWNQVHGWIETILP